MRYANAIRRDARCEIEMYVTGKDQAALDGPDVSKKESMVDFGHRTVHVYEFLFIHART